MLLCSCVNFYSNQPQKNERLSCSVHMVYLVRICHHLAVRHQDSKLYSGAVRLHSRLGECSGSLQGLCICCRKSCVWHFC